MVRSGEVDALVPERVWQEISRGLMEVRPSRLFEVLRECGALARVLPEVDRLFGVPQRADFHPEVDTGAHLLMVLDMAARLATSLAVRYACLGHDLGKGTTPAEILPRHLGHEERSVALARRMSERLRVDNACSSLAEVTAREHGNIHRSGEFGAAAIVRLLDRCDAWRRPDRFAELLLACECDARGRLGLEDSPYPQRARLLEALRLATAVDSTQVAAEAAARGLAGPAIGAAILAERMRAVEALLPSPAG
jgi:tRNA nucleotidyltransferase (CCA-adding enzyme)